MKLKALKLVPILICGGAITLACLGQSLLSRFGGLPVFQRLEWISYDWRLRTANDFHPQVSDKLGFVFIGDEALAVFSQGLLNTNLQFGLKWPRHIYGRVVRELKAQGANAVGLDIFFDDLRPDHAPAQTPVGLTDSDLFFAQQLKQAGNAAIGATKEVLPAPLFRTNAAALGDLSHERDSDGVLRRDRAFHDYRLWHRAIQNEALLDGWDLANARVQTNQIIFPKQSGGSAAIALNPDGYFAPTELSHAKSANGFVRLYKPFEEARVWHLGIVLAARELGLDLEKALVQLERKQIILSGTNGIRRIIPVDRHGQFLIDWSVRLKDKRLTTEAFESLVSNDILRQRGTNLAARFQGKLVIIGSTGTGNDLTDRGATPLDKDTFLTSNYWNVVNSVLTDRFIRPSPLLMDLLLIGLMGFGAAVLTWRLRAVWASLRVALLVSAWVLVALLVFIRCRWWLPIVMPAGAALLTHFGLLTYQAFFEQNERRRIKSIFAKLVSPNVVHELLKADKLPLGARGQVTIFFADVRGFTELTDRSHAQAEKYVQTQQLGQAEAKAYFDQQAQEVLNTVNLYLGLIADVIKNHAGTLDKYIGDCVMAFWGAPTPNEQHARACVRAAIDAQLAVYSLNQQRAAQNQVREQENPGRAAQGRPPLAELDLLTLGTGINTGVVTVGLMGSDAHILNYTVFGRDVNLASRLEGHSGRGRIVISEATYLELLRDDPALASTCISLPATKLKGFGTAVKIFEVPWKPRASTEVKVAVDPTEALS